MQEVLVSVAPPKNVLHDRCVGLISMIGIDAHIEIKKKSSFLRQTYLRVAWTEFDSTHLPTG